MGNLPQMGMKIKSVSNHQLGKFQVNFHGMMEGRSPLVWSFDWTSRVPFLGFLFWGSFFAILTVIFHIYRVNHHSVKVSLGPFMNLMDCLSTCTRWAMDPIHHPTPDNL